MKSNRIVSADVTIHIRDTGEQHSLRVANIFCEWVWADGSMAAAEYWVVADWVSTTFGNTIDWFNIKCVVGSPVKEGN